MRAIYSLLAVIFIFWLISVITPPLSFESSALCREKASASGAYDPASNNDEKAKASKTDKSEKPDPQNGADDDKDYKGKNEEKHGVFLRNYKIRKKPKKKAKVIARIKKGGEALIIKFSKSGRWTYVQLQDGKKGWLPTKYVKEKKQPIAEKAEPAKPAPAPTAVTAPSPEPKRHLIALNLISADLSQKDVDIVSKHLHDVLLNKAEVPVATHHELESALEKSEYKINAYLRDFEADGEVDECLKSGTCRENFTNTIEVRKDLLIGGSVYRYGDKWGISLYLFDLATADVIGDAVEEIEKDDKKSKGKDESASSDGKGESDSAPLMDNILVATTSAALRLIREHEAAFTSKPAESDLQTVTIRQAVPVTDQPKAFELLSRKEIDYEKVLKETGVRLYAVTFSSSDKAPNQKVISDWRKFQDSYNKLGLRTASITIAEKSGQCPTVGWRPDKTGCLDRSLLSSDWPYRHSPNTFLLDWQGNVLEYSRPASEVQESIQTYFRQTPRILVSAPKDKRSRKIKGKKGRKLKREIKNRIAKEGRFELLDNKKEKKELAGIRKKNPTKKAGKAELCRPRQRLSSTYRLDVSHKRKSRKDDKIFLELHALDNHCIVASAQADVVKRKTKSAVNKAVFEVLAPIALSAKSELPTHIVANKDAQGAVAVGSLPVYDMLARKIMFSKQAGADSTAAHAQAAAFASALQKNRLEQDEEVRKREEEAENLAKQWKMMWFTMSPRAGYGHYFDHGKILVEGFGARDSVEAMFTISMGGDDLGFELEPTYAYEWASDNRFKNFHLIGTHLGLYYRHVANQYIIPGVGFGLRGGYLIGDSMDHGLELYARIPVSFTIYAHKYFAIEIQLACGYGITGIAKNISEAVTGKIEDAAKQKCIEEKVKDLTAGGMSQADAQAQAEKECEDKKTSSNGDFLLAHGFMLEAMLGFRFP